MADILSVEDRSRLMSRIRGRDTKPEMAVRRYLHGRGLRYVLGGRGLPGRPDLVFPGRRAVVFVHGCYWHRHEGCSRAYTPKSRVEFWTSKFAENVARDRRATQGLEALGWRVLVIWECEIEESCLDGLYRELVREGA